MIFVIMYTNRVEISKLIEGVKEYDAQDDGFSYISEFATLTTAKPEEHTARSSTTGRQRRPSTIARATDLMWLSSKIDKFEPLRWWAAAFLILMRIMQTSVMALITNPSLQAAVASLIALVGVSVQTHAAPYRRSSDNGAGLTAAWLLFLWCFVLLVRYSGAVGDRHGPVLGALLIIATVGMISNVLRSLMADVSKDAKNRDVASSMSLEMGELSVSDATQAEPGEHAAPSTGEDTSVTEAGSASLRTPDAPSGSWGFEFLCGEVESSGQAQLGDGGK